MLSAANGLTLPIRQSTLRVSKDSRAYVTTFVVVLTCSHDVILGWDFPSSNDTTIECFNGTQFK